MSKILSKRHLTLAAFVLLASVHFSAISQKESKLFFASDPTLSPDGKTIVFAYEDDLWSVPAQGGHAARLTAMAGRESNPRYSPDGKWIAFTGRQDGNANVYILPTDGGDIKQLTFHEGSSVAESWSWDSKSIYFTSDAFNQMSSYKIAVDGGSPTRLFPHYFNWPHSLIENPKTGEWYFTDSWESSRFASRKRYKGEFNPDIKSWNPKTGDYKVHTTYDGKDMWPTIDANGNIYFVSDQENNEYNLYSLKDDKPVALTHFNTSIKQPQVDAAGDEIAFEKDYQIFLYNVASGKSAAVAIQLPANSTTHLSENFNIKGAITNFDISGDEKKLAFISRGELFVSDVEGKFIKQLPMEGTGRALEVKWLADNKTLIYNKTVNGWANWYKIGADGKSKEEELTHETQTNHALALNKKRTFGVYLSGRDELRRIDLENGKSETLLKDEFWAIENSAPAISPDGQYVAYTAKRNFEDDIFLYRFDDKSIINITNTGVSENGPVWSPDGKSIYFIADRLHPSYPFGHQEAKIYRIALDNTDKEFKEDKFDQLFTKESKADSLNASPNPIDMNNMADRWEELTPSSGNHFVRLVTIKKDETKVFFASETDGRGNPLSYWDSKPFTHPEIKKIEGGDVSEPLLVQGKTKIFMLSAGNLYEVDADGNKLKNIDVSFDFGRNMAKEFDEMFYETWAAMDENYYDVNFHGVDWEKTEKQYETYLPYVKNRANLRILLNDMLGELNSSHTGFSSSGGEERTFFNSRSMETGILFDNNNPYKVERVVAKSPADKKDKDIKPGDVLYAVDGQKVDASMNRDYYFDRPVMPDEVELSFKRGGDIIKVKIHPESPSVLKSQLYDEWIAGNHNLVEDKTGKRVSYIMMKDMTGPSLQKFEEQIANETYNRDALILDLRYNTGGNVHDIVLDILSRRPYLRWKYRDGKATTQPNFFPDGKPIVLLVNEQTLSDGEMTSAGFQALNLGKMVGTQTYHWIIFTSAISMVDGSVCRLPSWGCYKLNGDDIEKTGVTPDIIVKNNIKDRTEGNDPQLNKAIEVIMSELK